MQCVDSKLQKGRLIMNRWSDISTNNFYQVDKPEQEKYKIEFLRQIGVDINNICPSLFEKVEFLNENKITLVSDKPSYQDLCINDIAGTIHQDYGDIPLIEVFKRLKRGAGHCEAMIHNKSTPIFIHLRRSIRGKRGKNIKIIKFNGKYYISEGNHRISMMRICCLAEMEKSRCQKEQDEIVLKYTYRFPVYEAIMKER